MTQNIVLSNGTIALVDDADYERIACYRWSFNNGYASRSEFVTGRRKTVYLHRVVTEAPAGVEVDHINGLKADNRRANLRFVTHGQNEQNKRVARSDSKTGIRNVQLDRRDGRYYVRLWPNGKQTRFGAYATLEEAAAAAAEARRTVFSHSPENSVV